jgi:hypothetical protein
MKNPTEIYLDNVKRGRISKDSTNEEILWIFLEDDLELRTQIEYMLNDGYKINAIKYLKQYAEDEPQGKSDIYKNSNLRELKNTIDRYAIRYNITKKIKLLRKRIEKWARKNGHDNIGYQKEVKDNKTGEYTYRYSDWEFVDDQYSLMINDWDWLPVSKQMRLYNTLWKQYK